MKKLMIMIAILMGVSTVAQAKEINLGCDVKRVDGKKNQYDLYLNTSEMTGTRSDEEYKGVVSIQSDSYSLVIDSSTTGVTSIIKTVIDRTNLAVVERHFIDFKVEGIEPKNLVYSGKCQIKEAPKNQI